MEGVKTGLGCAFLGFGVLAWVAGKAFPPAANALLLLSGAALVFYWVLAFLQWMVARLEPGISGRMGGRRMANREVIIKETHRGLRYVDGVLKAELGAGRYEIPRTKTWFGRRLPLVEIVLVDVRERDLTIKGQEILTADKVAIRVSIIVQFRVTDVRAALHAVENYEDRLYSDVQLAARRSLASMSLEEILTNRNRLSEDISRDVRESAATYGTMISRADVKDLIFPGNLQEIMNRVLTAERLSQAQLIEARTKAEQGGIEARARADARRVEAEAQADAQRAQAQSQAEALRVQTQAEVAALRERAEAAGELERHPSLLRLRELETLSALAENANAKIVIGFDKHLNGDA